MSLVVVIGAGFAGLAAGAVLAARGHQVTIVEARDAVGGLARCAAEAGARVDLGPTILTDLAPLRLLARQLGIPLDGLARMRRLDPAFLATFPRTGEVPLHVEPEQRRAAVAALGPAAAADWDGFRDLGARAGRVAEHYYTHGDVRGVGDLLAFLIRGDVALRDVTPFLRHGSLHRLLRAVVRTPTVRSLLGHFARLMGAEAHTAPAVSLVIPYLLAEVGVWYPEGGMSALAAAICHHAEQRGASIRLGQAADGLEMTAGRVTAVRVNGATLPADACVAAVGPAVVAGWAGDGRLARRTARLRPARTARVAWWLVEGVPPRAVHHAYHFGDEPAAEPLYVAVPTLTDATVAPAGVSLIYALRHGPAQADVPADFASRLQAEVQRAGQWPGGRVLAAGVATDAGSCYGYAIGTSLLSARHPSQRAAAASNLLLAGKAVFPGPGVANVIRSGLRAAELAEATAQGGAR